MLVNSNKFLILGISKSGYSACNYLLSKGAVCYIFEENNSDKIKEKKEELISKGAIYLTSETIENFINIVDVVVLSPGVPINHEITIKSKSLGKRIISELELGFMLANPKIVGVTGTNGKTTTVSLINSILSDCGEKSLLLGNVGFPVTEKINVIDNSTICVTEISSFQMESTVNLRPDIACVLNISPDHLERHYTMENYIFLKRRLLQNLTESEFAILNYDDEVVRDFSKFTKGKIIFVSTKEIVDGAYKKDDTLYFKNTPIIKTCDLILQGLHNEYNALFAIAVSKLLGVDDINISKSLKNFKGIAHRIQLISEKNGIKVFNDSKATNTSSTISAIDCMKGNTVLILGGSEKGESYENLFEKIKLSTVKHVILTGASRFNMLDCASKVGYADITLTESFRYAIKISAMIAQNGDAVLFSPACASFDNFSSYEERGDAFVKAVEEL